MRNLASFLLVAVWFSQSFLAEGSTSYIARTPWITKRIQQLKGKETTVPVQSSRLAKKKKGFRLPWILERLRGGDDSSSPEVLDEPVTAQPTADDDEPSLDEKVHAAMRKLGLQVPPSVEEEEEAADSNDNCKDGVCELPSQTATTGSSASTVAETSEQDDDPNAIVQRLSESLKLETGMVWAALGATSTQNANGSRTYNEAAARELLQVELDMVASIPESSESVQTLQKEGHTDVFLVRRALAFAEGNLDNARAILIADEEEEEDEVEEVAPPPPSPAAFKTVNVDANFDPTQLGTPSTPAAEPSLPSPASKESVVFEATTAEVFELVLESPVPVLLDLYADWCGPCKALSPILEEMAIKSGGSFRLVKVNSDNERAVSGALEVTALPTVFAVREGKILHMFQGMPRSEEMMKSFLMGLLIPGESFSPPVTESEKEKYDELTNKLIKVTGAAGFPFSARERLQDRVATKLNELVEQTGDVYDAEQSARTVRSLLSNVIRDPFGTKFRSINLSNKVVAAKVAKYEAALAILKSAGFAASSSDSNTLEIGANKKLINVAPLTIARDAIDKWADKMRYDVAKAARKRKDEEDKKVVQADLAAKAAAAALEEEDEESEDEIDPNECRLKVRIEGKNKVHEIVLRADDSLKTVLQKAPGLSGDEEDVQITCVAKRLVIKSSDGAAMEKTLGEYEMLPSAALVLKTSSSSVAGSTASSSSIAERAAAKKKKTGSHTMQSVGIYAKDDNAKGELIDGGGGVWYEHDVTDDEEEAQINDDQPDADGDAADADPASTDEEIEQEDQQEAE